MLLALVAGIAERAFSPPAFFFAWDTSLFAVLGAVLGFILCGNGLRADNGASDSGIRDISSTYASAGLWHLGRLFARLSFVSMHPASAVCLGLGLCGIALALPEPLASPFAVSILSAAEGCVSVAAVAALAGLSLPPLRRAALALGAAFVLSNLGSAAAGIPALLSTAPDMLMLSRAAWGLIVMAALVLFAVYRRRARVKEKPDVEPAQEIPPTPAEPESTAVTFTAREREILSLIRQGLNNREIAETLHVQEVTVRFHLRNLYQKTGLTEREQLAALRATDG
jgi:DNA-binding NarL/FixJ family response regulator